MYPIVVGFNQSWEFSGCFSTSTTVAYEHSTAQQHIRLRPYVASRQHSVQRLLLLLP